MKILLDENFLDEFLRTKPAGRLFDLYETGKILGWEIRESR